MTTTTTMPTIKLNVPINNKSLKATDLANAFIFATDWLGVYVDEVNSLNVYPVPDGDTGTNMHLTMQSVRRHLKEKKPTNTEELAQALAKGSLLGARGNSGVILSQSLRGFSDVIRDHSEINAQACIKALQNASKIAYEALMAPVEGTMLTVIRRAAEGVAEMSHAHPLEILKTAWQEGHKALQETPEMLPILKKAGVVDSGGLGFLRVLEGIIASYEGKDLPPSPKVTQHAQTNFEEEEHGFCTEFLLSNVTTSIDTLRDIVKDFGDSIVLVEAEGYVKGHIHTQEPERLLGIMGRHGSMVKSKVEDMSLQHSELLDNINLDEVEPANVGLVCVSAGYGVNQVFRSLGAHIVSGGQTNNPSVEDIADTVRGVAAKHVIILPNNKNVIMAADHVVDIITDKTIQVLPTCSLGQGLAASVVFDAEGNADEVISAMQEASSAAQTFEITFASKDAKIDDLTVKKGNAIGLVNGKLKTQAATPEDCLFKMLETYGTEAEIGTLFYNSEVNKKQANDLVQKLEANSDVELELHAGGPDVYRYVLALE